ncbi:unnamed protein product [Oreochromis niloticus]|nr:unnamed protein product [Mustela putorius furo]
MRCYGLDGYYNHTLADWLCLTSSASNFNTSAITHRFDGAKFYGIFQVKGGLWCNDDDPKSARCGVSCTELLTDNVRVAIECAQAVVRERQGLKAW